MSILPAVAVLDTMNTLNDFLGWSGLTQAEWTVVATALGQADLDNVVLIAAIDDSDFADARKELTLVRRGALNLTIGAVKMKFGLETSFLPRSAAAQATAAAQPPAASCSGAATTE